MQFKARTVLLCLLTLFSFSVASAQERTGSATSPEDEDIGCVLNVSSRFVEINFSVWSSKKGFLKNLTYKDFEVYDREEIQKIDFFLFDESKNQYLIGFEPKDEAPNREKYDVKIKVKLSRQGKKDYGEITVMP